LNGNPNMAAATAYFDGLNEKLKAAIPADARSVLEFGCANGYLGAACKAGAPGLRWTGVDVSAAAVAEAAIRLDATIHMNLDEPDPLLLGRDHDVVVFGDVLEHLRDPLHCLRAAHAASSPDARLVCCIPNMAHVSVIERLLAGDLSYDTAGLLDATHLRFLTPASTFKLLADAGWVPNLRDRYLAGHGNQEFLQQLIVAAKQLGIPDQTALSHLLSYQLIIDCIKMPPTPAGATAPFSVVVPVTNRQQFELNVRRSPGLAEVQAQVIPVEGSANPAEALAKGRGQAQSPWIVFCHQDIYFPSGTGHALAGLFGAIPAAEAAGTLIGFAGIGQLPGAAPGPAGLVVDRTLRFDYPESPAAISMDELAIAVRTDTVHAIDPALGWHLWATDLCLASRTGRPGCARIVRIPLFHNSYNDGQLPAAFHASAQVLRNKYPQLPEIHTLCGIIR
jgi:SAM-dependent methyltransferase